MSAPKSALAAAAPEPRCAVGPEVLSVEAVSCAVAGTSCGAVITFAGTVRGETRGRAVLCLEYEAYVPMAVKVLRAIADEAARRWPGVRVAVRHRTGRLEPGELAVVVAAAAPHRADAFAACQQVIDRLKQDAPIWKKEIYADGASWVGLGS